MQPIPDALTVANKILSTTNQPSSSGFSTGSDRNNGESNERSNGLVDPTLTEEPIDDDDGYENRPPFEYFYYGLYHVYFGVESYYAFTERHVRGVVKVYPGHFKLDSFADEMEKKLIDAMPAHDRERIKTIVLIKWRLLPNKF